MNSKNPNHIAIIMDGNGRWAKLKGMMRSFGHKNGVKTVKEIVEACREKEINYLTLYAFSTENNNRPQTEVSYLMKLFISTIDKELEALNKNDIRIMAIGDLENLPKDVFDKLAYAKEKTKNNKFTLSLAINYGAKNEILHSFKNIYNKIKNSKLSIDSITESDIENNLYTKQIPPVDLLIRTGGEQRLSNFMLWQSAYAELYFTNVFWPDFNKKEFEKAIEFYKSKERRFGKTSDQIK